MASSGAGIAWSVLGILLCGGIGGSLGWLVMRGLGLGGTDGALVAVVLGMVITVAAWVGLTTLLRALRILR